MTHPTDLGGGSKPVLVIAFNYPPQNTSGGVRPSRFAKYLPDHGYQAQIVASPFQPEPCPQQVHRVPTPGPVALGLRLAEFWHDAMQSLVSPYNERLPWVPHAVAAGLSLLDGAEPPVAILSTSPPLATHVVALRLKRRGNLKWIADFRDPLFGNPFNDSRRAAIYYRSLERRIMIEADVVIANTEPFAGILCRRYPRQQAKVICLPNGYDPLESFGPAPIPARPYRVIAHVGTIYRGRHPRQLLASLERLIAQRALLPGVVRVELVGRIEPPLTVSLDRPPFTTLLEKGCLYFDGIQVSRVEARRKVAEADYLLLLDLNERGVGLQVPAKLYEYLLVGRPILAFSHRGSPTAEILVRSGVRHTLIYDTDSEEQTDRAVLAFLQYPTEPVKSSEWFRERYDARSQTRQLACILDGLLTRSR